MKERLYTSAGHTSLPAQYMQNVANHKSLNLHGNGKSKGIEKSFFSRENWQSQVVIVINIWGDP